ncbi:MAG: DUF4143 domain-containing protein [Bifidobacteriaceae bacterium]|nr:DUF4143 domain-containing protein [Bifidobacteriaceae bacterium]
MGGYIERIADPVLAELMGGLPAVMVTGARGVGKTTTALRHAASVVRLDDPEVASAFRASPAVALAGMAEPILIDEWQEVPAVLGAVKRSVDSDPRPGRFILTGSVRANLMAPTWPGTGRIVPKAMEPLSQREIDGRVGGTAFLERLRQADAADLGPDGSWDLGDYVDAALAGGYPSALATRPGPLRQAWLEGYAEQIATRDAAALGERRDPDKLRAYLQAAALNTAGIVQDKTLEQAAGIAPATARAYEQLLKNLSILSAAPAWRSNRLASLGKAPKRFIADTALAAAILGADRADVFQSGNLMGRLIETFAFQQLRAELQGRLARSPRLAHVRDTHQRHEVDLVVEYPDGAIAGIEVKAASAVGPDSARHLEWLRDGLGDKFAAGVVLHTGPARFEFSDRVFAAPIAAIWA